MSQIIRSDKLLIPFFENFIEAKMWSVLNIQEAVSSRLKNKIIITPEILINGKIKEVTFYLDVSDKESDLDNFEKLINNFANFKNVTLENETNTYIINLELKSVDYLNYVSAEKIHQYTLLCDLKIVRRTK